MRSIHSKDLSGLNISFCLLLVCVHVLSLSFLEILNIQQEIENEAKHDVFSVMFAYHNLFSPHLLARLREFADNIAW